MQKSIASAAGAAHGKALGRRRRTFRWSLGIALGPLMASAPALADPAAPLLAVEFPVEIQNDWTFSAEDPTGEVVDLYATIEPNVTLRLAPFLTLESGLVFEPVRDADPGEDRVFEDQGLFAEQLFLRATVGAFEVYGGKFNPPFGVAFDRGPGIYGTDFAEDYELTERIGLGGAWTGMADAEGQGHRLSVNGYFADTSALSGSLFTRRGRLSRDDGGLSNTGSLDSLAVSLEGSLGAGFGYHASFRHQAPGETEGHAENGFAIAFYGEEAPSETVTLTPLFEFVHLDHADGIDQNRNYVTTGVTVAVRSWSLALSYTLRETVSDDPDLEAEDDLFQASIGYAFDNGLALSVGYRYSEEGGQSAHGLGLLLHYDFAFTLP